MNGREVPEWRSAVSRFSTDAGSRSRPDHRLLLRPAAIKSAIVFLADFTTRLRRRIPNLQLRPEMVCSRFSRVRSVPAFFRSVHARLPKISSVAARSRASCSLAVTYSRHNCCRLAFSARNVEIFWRSARTSSSARLSSRPARSDSAWAASTSPLAYCNSTCAISNSWRRRVTCSATTAAAGDRKLDSSITATPP